MISNVICLKVVTRVLIVDESDLTWKQSPKTVDVDSPMFLGSSTLCSLNLNTLLRVKTYEFCKALRICDMNVTNLLPHCRWCSCSTDRCDRRPLEIQVGRDGPSSSKFLLPATLGSEWILLDEGLGKKRKRCHFELQSRGKIHLLGHADPKLMLRYT